MPVNEEHLAGKFFTNQSYNRLDGKVRYVLPRTVRKDLNEVEELYGNNFMMDLYWKLGRWIATVEWTDDEDKATGQWKKKFRYQLRKERKAMASDNAKFGVFKIEPYHTFTPHEIVNEQLLHNGVMMGLSIEKNLHDRVVVGWQGNGPNFGYAIIQDEATGQSIKITIDRSPQ